MVMLRRKLFRDLLHMRGQVFAIALVVGLSVGIGDLPIPLSTTWSAVTPASSMAFRHASMQYAPSVLSIETPSQRRSIWDWPHPTTATLPRCSQTPIPSRVLLQPVSLAISAPSWPLCCAPLP